MTGAARRDTPKRDVVLIGRNDFQNKLLARMITERIECNCLVRSIEDLRGPSRASSSVKHQRGILLKASLRFSRASAGCREKCCLRTGSKPAHASVFSLLRRIS